MQPSLITSDELGEGDITAFVKLRLINALPPDKPSIYQESPFLPMAKRNPKQRGKTGETLVAMLANSLDFTVTPSIGGDLQINGIDVEVKMAMQGADGGFQINQLRPQSYRYVACLILRPQSAWIFTVPKHKILALSKGQHGGKNATETMAYNASNFAKLWGDFGEYSGRDVFARCFSSSSKG